MNLNKQSTVAAGVILIGLGIVVLFNLWSLIFPAALLVGGVAAYQQRRRMGHLNEAVQVGMWGVGLALLFLVHFFWPGVLFLAGASVLARGREGQIDAYAQRLITQFSPRSRPTARPTPTQNVPITTSYPQPLTPAAQQRTEAEKTVATGETTRL
jgi:hypothetical protein